MSPRCLPLLALLCAPLACASPPDLRRIDDQVEQIIRRTQTEYELEHLAEAYTFGALAIRFRPEDERLLALKSEALAEHGDLFYHPYLGSNFRRRMPADRSVLGAALLYLPDRVLDLLDVLSFDVHVGLGAFANVHVTRALQLGAGARGVVGFGWHDHRSLGLQTQAEAGIVAVGLGAEGYGGTLAGTSGIVSGGEGLAGLHRPSNPLYQQYRDYWAIGAAVTVVFVGVDFDLHPVELVDAVLGFATIDILNDDFARTTGMRINSVDRELLAELSQVAQDPETLEAYRAWRAENAR